jgi:hypothetical protein
MFQGLIYECRSEVLEGAGDPDMHTVAAEVLGKKGRPKPEDANRRPEDRRKFGAKSGVMGDL